MKIRPLGAELFHVDGRTDVTQLTAAFRNVAKGPRNDISSATHSTELQTDVTVNNISVTHCCKS